MSAVTDALIGNRRYLEAGIGFEPASRAARLVLMGQLNDEIAKVAESWWAADTALQQLGMDPGVPAQLEVPVVLPANFHEGPKKSIIDAPPEAFPNVTVMAFATVPSASQFGDQVDSSDITLFVETKAISGPVPDTLDGVHETIVHRRIQRMTEAVANVMSRNQTLLGAVHKMSLPPRGGIGNNSWLHRPGSTAGDRYVWHGSRLQYTLQRHHV